MPFSPISNTFSNDTSDGFNVTSPAIDTTLANLIVLAAISRGDNTAYTISDSKGNTWTPLTLYASITGVSVRIYYVVSPIVGTGHTFTLTGGRFPTVFISAWNGSHLTPFDQQNGAVDDASSGLSTGNIIPNEANELIISCCALDGPLPLTVSGDSLSALNTKGTVSDFGGGMAYEIQTASITLAATWTPSGVRPLAVAIASFKASSVVAARPFVTIIGAKRI